jgi:hypothetical protein
MVSFKMLKRNIVLNEGHDFFVFNLNERSSKLISTDRLFFYGNFGKYKDFRTQEESQSRLFFYIKSAEDMGRMMCLIA